MEDWEKEMEEFFDNMTDEDFQQFLVDTKYEYYSKFKCFCLFFNVPDGCTWTEDFIEWIDCCPIPQGSMAWMEE